MSAETLTEQNLLVQFLTEMTIVHADLRQAIQMNKRSGEELLRYQNFREGLFSQFVGDFFSYFNSDRGRKIRQSLALQLRDFLEHNPAETEIHIIAHSLGSVILWDILLSSRLKDERETQAIRSMLQLNRQPQLAYSARLTSITTMGSPIVFANQMLGAGRTEWQRLLETYQNDSALRWANIVHPADVIAYPIASAVRDAIATEDSRLKLQDFYLNDDADLFEKTAQAMGQDHVAMALKTGNAHVSYFGDRSRNQQTIDLIINNLLNQEHSKDRLEDVFYKFNFYSQAK